MNKKTLTVQYLKDVNACQSGIDFVVNNGLEGLSLDLLDKVEGDYLGFISFLKKAPEIEYDSNNNRIKEVWPNGDVYTWEYDSNNNMIKEVDPNGDVCTWEYDSNNNMIKKVDTYGDVCTLE